MTNTKTEQVDTEESGGGLHLGWALVLISVAQLMVVLDGTIVNIALPYIQHDLDIASANLTWVVTGYALAFGSLLLLGGRLGDLYGRRKIFMIGLAIFAVASGLGGLANTEATLLAARGLQGLGAALASPAALALITTTFPAGPARNRAFAVYAAMSGAGAAVGLLLGGWLTGLSPTIGGLEIDGWRLTLLINLPIGLAAAGLAPRFLRESEAHRPQARPPRRRARHPGSPRPGLRLQPCRRRRLDRPVDDRQPGRRRDPARRLHPRREPLRGPAAALPGVHAPHPRGVVRGDVPRPGRDVRDVLLPQPVHPERHGLQPDRGRRRVPALLRRHRGRRRAWRPTW